MRITTLFAVILLLGSVSSCKVAYRTLLGVDSTPNWQSIEKVGKISKRRGIPSDQAFILDTASFMPLVTERAKSQIAELKSDGEISSADSLVLQQIKKEHKNDGQPVQLRYFNSSGEPIFKIFNCYVDPIFPMRWNIQGSLDVYPPAPIEDLKNDFNDDLQTLLPFIKTMDGKSVHMADLPKADYYAIVFWNSYMIRPSKRLISQIKKYNKKKGNNTTHILFVNNHRSELWHLMGNEDKEKVKALENKN